MHMHMHIFKLTKLVVWGNRAARIAGHPCPNKLMFCEIFFTGYFKY
jgi:hypothetical protein